MAGSRVSAVLLAATTVLSLSLAAYMSVRAQQPARTESAAGSLSALDHVENRMFKLGLKEVPSATIGELVMDELRKLDKVAYIRFASVYRKFEDIEAFEDAINEIRPSDAVATSARRRPSFSRLSASSRRSRERLLWWHVTSSSPSVSLSRAETRSASLRVLTNTSVVRCSRISSLMRV